MCQSYELLCWLTVHMHRGEGASWRLQNCQHTFYLLLIQPVVRHVLTCYSSVSARISKWMCVWLGDWVSMRVCECEWMSEQMMYEHVWASEWVSARMLEWVIERLSGWEMGEGWVGERMGEWGTTRPNEWMNERISKSHILVHLGCFNHFDVNISVLVLLIPIT